MITRYVLPALFIALLGAAGLAWWQSSTIDRLRGENASLARSVAALEGQRDQARLAADVAQASAERERARAEEYDRLRESLLKGNTDEKLPDWFRDYLDDLLGRVPG